MKSNGSVLLVDDESELVLSLSKALKNSGLRQATHAAGNPKMALELQQTEHPEVAIIDLSLNITEGVESGYALLKDLIKSDPSIRVIVLTGHGALQYGIKALTLGAASFVEKPGDPVQLKALIEDGVAQARLWRAHRELSEQGRSASAAESFLGSSDAASSIRSEIEFSASNDQPVLIMGETGTGKGLAALLIHTLSARSDKRFIRYQPGFGSSELSASELFGHKKGAFTGAESDRSGLLKLADAGSLFLDEIDSLPPDTQVSLLGALQEKRFRPLGSDLEISSNFRLVAATNCPESELPEKVRPDLYHRVAHHKIVIPALRERREDISVLADDFLNQLIQNGNLGFCSFTQETTEHLRAQDWPGNVRELHAAIEGAAYRAQFNGEREITPDHFTSSAPLTLDDNDKCFYERVADFKLKLIQEALDRCGGNQARAARELGVDRSTIRRIINAA